MADDLTDFIATRMATADRPLLGLTVLVVEDSRFACEAIRLLCLRSGARIRRADCLRSARRHLQVYRPSVIIVDLGLPDGSGIELIRELTAAGPRLPAILATSGDPGRADAALAAGADGFLAKPVDSLAGFQQAVLAALPALAGAASDARAAGDRIEPDPLALRDDLIHAADVLDQCPDDPDDRTLDYVAQFLAGLARSAADAPLAAAAEALARERRAGLAGTLPVAHVRGLVRERIAPAAGW